MSIQQEHSSVLIAQSTLIKVNAYLGLFGRSGSGKWSDVRNSAIRVSAVSVRAGGVRIGDVLNSGDDSWITGIRVAGERADSVEGIETVLVPRWVDTMDAEVLLSSFLILGLHGESASGQSHQNQKALYRIILKMRLYRHNI